MSIWHSSRITANGIKIHYTRTGGEKPPIVLVHGFSDDGLCWTPTAARLASQYDVIMPDARGHGRSDAPETGYGLQEMAEDLAEVIRGLSLHKPVVLGHSMGGGMTYLMAGMYPNLPGAILIEDSGIRNLTTGRAADRAERRQQMQERMLRLKKQSREELITGGRDDSPGWSESELGPWADAKLRFSLHALNRLDSVVVNWARDPTADRLSRNADYSGCRERGLSQCRGCSHLTGHYPAATGGSHCRCGT